MLFLSRLIGSFFFIFWLGISGTVTFMFSKGIHESVQNGATPWMYAILLFPACFVTIGIWGIVTTWTDSSENNNNLLNNSNSNKFTSLNNKNKSKTEYAKSTSIGAFLFGLPFLLPGLGIMIFLAIIPTIKTALSYQWVEVPAKIISSGIKTNHNSDGNTHELKVRYQYEYKGLTYFSDKYDFMKVSTSNYNSIKKQKDSIHQGSIQKAYVNPKKPQEAVLSRKFSWFCLFIFLFGSVFAGVGGFICFSSLLNISKGNVSKSTLPQKINSPGSIILKSKTGNPLGRFIGILIFTIIWSGAVYFIFTKGAPLLFKIVFGGFNVFAIAGACHSFLALFNPKPIIEVSNQQVMLGKSINLNWKIKGDLKSIEDFSIILLGQEEATYRRGTDSYTEHSEFFKQEIIHKTSQLMNNQGAATITIPTNTMHSWNSSNNKIVWQLNLQAKISKWPDIKESYEIIVLPY